MRQLEEDYGARPLGATARLVAECFCKFAVPLGVPPDARPPTLEEMVDLVRAGEGSHLDGLDARERAALVSALHALRRAGNRGVHAELGDGRGPGEDRAGLAGGVFLVAGCMRRVAAAAAGEGPGAGGGAGAGEGPGPRGSLRSHPVGDGAAGATSWGDVLSVMMRAGMIGDNPWREASGPVTPQKTPRKTPPRSPLGPAPRCQRLPSFPAV